MDGAFYSGSIEGSDSQIDESLHTCAPTCTPTVSIGTPDCGECSKASIGRFSDEQKAAARTILEHYTNMRRWVILLAQMQSGKTDTYVLVAFELLRRKMVNQVVIFAGFQDKKLVEQLKDIAPSLALYQEFMEHDLCMSLGERTQTAQGFKKRFRVLCGADLEQPAKTSASDVLYIWDESHYAQNVQNRPYHFLKSVKISPDGESCGSNRLFLSVSATPFSELCDAIHEKQPKQIVKMTPGEGYVGVGFLYRNGNINPVQRWDQDLPVHICRQLSDPTPKYSIVRIRGESDIAKAIAIAVSCRIDYEVYDAQHKSQTKRTHDSSKMQSFASLKIQPLRHKVVFIRGMLRMGKRIPKKHMSFVMETSNKAKTDVLLQGLIGRMCGYHSNLQVKIFVGGNVFRKGNDGLHEIDRYIKMMDGNLNVSLVPRCATNLVCGPGVK
jgi:hypothetical protein